ncbi:MAG: efflux transporter outer membrane subunit [Verrucomicrobia bacterium]|nr:efflux transporter outer membrane subunit [Verrucomicrobiota bacterium]
MRRFLLLLTLLSGCVQVPEHELAVELDRCGMESVTAEAVDSGNFQAGDWPTEAWWEQFNDPVLTHLIEEGLKSNPSLMMARSRLNAAAQVALQRRAALFPEISFDPADSWQHYSKNGFFRTYAPTIPALVNDIVINMTFVYEFDIWGKYRDLFKAALGEERARLAEVRQAELVLAASIAYTYQELQYLLFRREILRKQEAIRDEAYAIRDKREKNALDTAIITLGSKSETLDVSATLREIEPIIRQHVNVLKTLAGMDQDAAIEIQLNPLHVLSVSLPENLSLDLISRRPDLIALKERVEAAAKKIDAAKTEFYPNLNLISLVGLESVFWNKIFKQDTYSGTLHPAIHLPIFTAGRLRAELMEKIADFNEAVYAYNNLILNATQEIADTLTSIIYLQQEIEIRQESLNVVRQQEKLTRKRLEHALDDKITWLQAQYSVLDMELYLASLEYGKQLEGIVLIRELGGGFHGCP